MSQFGLAFLVRFFYVMMPQVKTLACFGTVECGNHFIVDLLSHLHELGPIFVNRVSTSIRLRIDPSCRAFVSSRYLASAVLIVVHLYFLDARATWLEFYLNMAPDIDFQSPLFSEKSAVLNKSRTFWEVQSFPLVGKQ